MKILLGCGDVRREGWVHHDKRPSTSSGGKGIDVVWDLEHLRWAPFADESASEIEATGVLEHLHDTVAFMDECWRILRPGGRLRVEVPDWRSDLAWGDPTHVRAFTPETFEYFDPDYAWHKIGRLYTERAWRIVCTRLGRGLIEVELVKRGSTGSP